MKRMVLPRGLVRPDDRDSRLFPGIILAGLLPSIAPTRSATEIAQFWSTNTGLKRCGLVMLLTAAGLQAPLRALNGLGWLPFIMNWPAATIQCLVIAFAIFGYRGTRPVWPK